MASSGTIAIPGMGSSRRGFRCEMPGRDPPQAYAVTNVVALVRSAVIVTTAAVAPLGANGVRSICSTQPASIGATGTPPSPVRVSAIRNGAIGRKPEPGASTAAPPVVWEAHGIAWAGVDPIVVATTAASNRTSEPPALCNRERIVTF